MPHNDEGGSRRPTGPTEHTPPRHDAASPDHSGDVSPDLDNIRHTVSVLNCVELGRAFLVSDLESALERARTGDYDAAMRSVLGALRRLYESAANLRLPPEPSRAAVDSLPWFYASTTMQRAAHAAYDGDLDTAHDMLFHGLAALNNFYQDRGRS